MAPNAPLKGIPHQTSAFFEAYTLIKRDKTSIERGLQ
jgi:hypothetical protein